MNKKHDNYITKNTSKKIVGVAVASFLAISVTAHAADNQADQKSSVDKMEKCYGIVKKGMNDCQTKTASCAGSATKDNQKDAFLFLPKGDCEKIVTGSLTSSDDTKK